MSNVERETTYSFVVEWFDQQASLTRQYLLCYFVIDDTIEMYDVKNKRTFLKRCKYPQVVLEDLFIGALVTVYARQVKVVDFGDPFTKRQLTLARSRTIALLKPKQWGRLGVVVDALYKNNFVISRMRSVQFSPSQAQEYFGDSGPSMRSQRLSQGPVIAMEIVGVGAEQLLLDLIGEEEEKSMETNFSNRTHDMEADFIFSNPEMLSSARMSPDSTICVIRPHIVLGGAAGEIIDRLQQEGLSVSGVQIFSLDRQAASEFCDVYKGIIPQVNAMVDELCTGACFVVELTGAGALAKLRAICGPPDPEIARHLNPESLRAQYGMTKIKNAVHCTDLPDDGPLESSFFFEEVHNSEVNKCAGTGRYV